MENDTKPDQKKTSETSESHLSTQTLASYRRVVTHLIIKTRLCFLQPSLSAEETAIATNAWTEILRAARVPEERLNDCYLYAATHRGSSSYPMSVNEIAAAWKELGDNRPIWMASKK